MTTIMQTNLLYAYMFACQSLLHRHSHLQLYDYLHRMKVTHSSQELMRIKHASTVVQQHPG